jgi:hypothetical protein
MCDGTGYMMSNVDVSVIDAYNSTAIFDKPQLGSYGLMAMGMTDAITKH